MADAYLAFRYLIATVNQLLFDLVRAGNLHQKNYWVSWVKEVYNFGYPEELKFQNSLVFSTKIQNRRLESFQTYWFQMSSQIPRLRIITESSSNFKSSRFSKFVVGIGNLKFRYQKVFSKGIF